MIHEHQIQETPTGVVDGSNTEFELANVPDGSVRVYINGLEQKLTTDYTVAGTTITMAVAPRAADGDNPADEVKVHYRTAV